MEPFRNRLSGRNEVPIHSTIYSVAYCPWRGTLKTTTLLYEEYKLPLNEPATGAHLHGLVHRQPFTVKYCGESEIKLNYENKGDIYPFPFLLKVNYLIKNGVFRQEYTVINTGKSEMPFTFALHTTFIEPNSFSVPIDLCQEKDVFHIPTGKYVPLNRQEQGYVSGGPSKGLVISGYYRACGHTAYWII